MNEYERGLLTAFCRLNLSDAQMEIMGKFYPELLPLCGIMPAKIAGIPAELYMNVRDLCVVQDKRISAIRELRNVTGWGLYDSKQFIDKYFPRKAG